MKMDMGLRLGQADRLRVGDKVDVVSALCELKSQLCGDHATSAIRRVTRDSDLHGLFRPRRSLVSMVLIHARFRFYAGPTRMGEAGSCLDRYCPALRSKTLARSGSTLSR